MKLALAQINTTVGDFQGNYEKISFALERAEKASVDLVVFPELSLCGYPPQDLLRKKIFLSEQNRLLKHLAKRCRAVAALVGFAREVSGKFGKNVANAAALLHRGKITFVQDKTLLPTYDVFDETRYFRPALKRAVISFQGMKLGITICEDIWTEAVLGNAEAYENSPLSELKKKGAQVILNLSASPFHLGKEKIRQKLLEKLSKKHRLPIFYCNLVGGNDSLIFDGGSLAFDASGKMLGSANRFAEDFLIFEISKTKQKKLQIVSERSENPNGFTPAWEARHALVLGLRDYVQKCGFQKALIGLSGGIDSALTAALAVEALGAENIWGIAMPSRFSSAESREDARLLAKKLGIRFDIIPIEDGFATFLKTLKPVFGQTPFGLAEENLQARLRGTVAMALSNKFGHLLLTTGNKSEMAVGYCTLYGDMNGGLAVIADCPKTLVYEISKTYGELIPPRIMTKEPSAGAPSESERLGLAAAVPVLDEILKEYIENDADLSTIIKRTGHAEELVTKIIQMVDRAEYKRRQAAPSLRITPKAFGVGRRLPIAQRFHERLEHPRKIALFGGSFNPPHRGHFEVLRHLATKKTFDEIWLMPTNIHPFGKNLLSFSERLHLCGLLLQDIGPTETPILVSPVEAEIPGESRTVKTLDLLKARHPQTEFTLVLGSDLKKEVKKWKDFSRVKKLAHVYFVPRRGFEAENRALSLQPFAPEISSTILRQALARGESLTTWFTPQVLSYIEAKNLFGSAL